MMNKEVNMIEMVAKKKLFLQMDVTGSDEHCSVEIEVGVRIVDIEIDLKHNLWWVYVADGMGGITHEHEIQISDADRFKKLHGFLTNIALGLI